MSGSASLTLEQGILQHTLGIAAMAFPAQIYVALCAAGLPPSESVGGVEAFGGGYSRVAATFALLASPTNVAANTASVEFPLATADWGSLGFFEIWSAQTGGSRLYWGGLIDPATGSAITLDVAAGDIVRFSAGTLAVEVAAPTPSGVSGVSSFNTRTGAVILSNSDVVGVLPPSANPPQPPGTAAVGTSAAWARGDHVHPSDAGIAAAAAAAWHNVGRNLLHNTLFRVAQRTGPFTALNAYTLDRWFALSSDAINIVQATSNDGSRAQIGDEEHNFFLSNTFTGGTGGVASYCVVVQRIENVRRLAGKTVTVSLWANAGTAIKLGVCMEQTFGTGGSPSAIVQGVGQAVTLNTTWTRYSFTFAVPSITGKTLGTNNDSSTGLLIWYSAGSNNNTRSGSIGIQSGTINVWGVQLEVGSTATPLEKLDPQQDLANCQRFYQSQTAALYGYSNAGAGIAYQVAFPVCMRAAPTIAFGTPTYINASGINAGGVTNAGFLAGANATAAGPATFYCSFTASADL